MAKGSWSRSRQAAKQVDGIADRIDPQSNAAPLDGIAFASDQVLNRGDVAAIPAGPELDVAKRKPEFVHLARQRYCDGDGVGLIDRFFHEADDIAVIDRKEAQLACLLQRRGFPAGAAVVADVGGGV